MFMEEKPSRLKKCSHYSRNSSGDYGFFANAMKSSSELEKWELNMHCENIPQLRKLAVSLLKLAYCTSVSF